MTEEPKSNLADAERAHEALAMLIRRGKALNPKQTLGFLAKKADIPSTGYLSDVMSGRRILHAKYRDVLLDALNVTGTVRSFVTVLLAIEDLDGGPGSEELVREREAIRKVLRQQSRQFPERLAGMFFAFEVFAAFGLSGQKATRDQLRAFFGVGRGVEIERALGLLLQSGLIERDGETFRIVSDQFYFIGKDGLSHIDYLTMALREAEEKVGAWYERPDRSFFVSSILSVKDSTYRVRLPELKAQMKRFESDLETGDADRLIRVNVQVYPLEK